MERLNLNDLETQIEPMFVYFKHSRQPGESFGDFCDRVGFDSLREEATKYEFQTTATSEITDDSDGQVEAMADSTTAEVTDNSDGQEVAVENTTTAASKVRRRISLQEEVYSKLKEAAARQGKPMTELVTEAIVAYLQGQSDS